MIATMLTNFYEKMPTTDTTAATSAEKSEKTKSNNWRVAAGKKAAQTNIKRYGEAVYEVLGRAGGSTRTEKTKNKGFGSDRERAREAGRKGGRISKR